MSDFRISVAAYGTDASFSVGEQLRQAREASGLSYRDLAVVTKIQASMLQYLEEDRFEEFPAEVFCRGFLRNYARELRLDEDEIIDQYLRQTKQRPRTLRDSLEIVANPMPPASKTEKTASHFVDRSSVGRAAYAVGLAVLVIMIALSVLVLGGENGANTTASYQSSDFEEVDGWQTAPATTEDEWRTVQD